MSFNELNDTFNVDGEVVPSTDRKLKKITSQVDDIKKDYEEIDTRLASGWYVDDINIPKKIYKTKQTSFKISKKLNA